MASEKDKYNLKALIKELSKFKGRHTELVTVYIPSGSDIQKVINQLYEEQGTAVNIKSTSTRKNVTDALERMIQHLKLFKQTPPNGLCVFSGNVSEREGESDVKVWSIEPLSPLNIRLYRCDKKFVLDALEEMLEEKSVYGLIVIDRRDAIIAILKGKAIIPLHKTHSEVPGKFKSGGQSAQRFARLIEGSAKDHYKKVYSYMLEAYMKQPHLKGIIIGGPGHSKNNFIEEFNEEFKKKIIAIKDITYTDQYGLEELVERSQDVLMQEEIAAEKKIMTKFFEQLRVNPAKVCYGKDDCMDKVQKGMVDLLLISATYPEDDLYALEEEAKKYSTKIEIISTETREGVQLKEIGGIVGMLRYESH